MTADFSSFLRLFGESLRDPAAVARQINALRWPHEISWMGLAAISAITVVLIYADAMLFGRAVGDLGQSGRPFVDAIINFASAAVLVFVLYYAGRAIGGTGTFGATLLIMTWMNAILLVMLCIILISALIMPGLASIISLICVGLTFYCLAHFLNELHGFGNIFKAIGLFIVAVCGCAFGLALILILIGGASVVGSAAL